ncbi:CGNR zinc finger domain-containing protein [Yunchengibacter salinarum]|uniref:CGNR zinc finger domain-containing protein n=1 Tax=Yunchengibacter salinarum TaxID=3133399 RepID=UPI0035B58577
MTDLVDGKWTETAFLGGDPALDFINTVSDDLKTRVRTRLTDWERLVGWTRMADLDLPAPPAAEVPDDAGQQLTALHQVREAVYHLLLARRDGAPPAPLPQDLTRAFQQVLARARMVSGPQGVQWQAVPGPAMLHDAILIDLHRFLTTGPLDKVRQCGRCSWLFLNPGRGRGRQWCSMRLCGNRTKVATHRQRRAHA